MKIYRNAVEIYDLAIDSNTKLYQKLMGEDLIKMVIVVDSKLDLQIGDYVVYNSINYTINRPVQDTKISEVEYHYTIQFESPIYNLTDKTVLLNGSADFYLTGYLTDFVDLIIANINEIHSGWTKGTVDASDWINVYFSNKNCKEALDLLATEFDVEFSVVNKTINVRERIENATALTFQHGKGNGLYELSRENVDDGNTVTRVRAFGAKRNIPYDYRGGARRLIFENLDGTNYLDNTSEYSRIIEKVITFENIYPRFEGAVTAVSADKLTVTCSTIDFDLNSYLQEGITAKVVFINGDLMGSQFEISNYDHASKSFKLIQGASDGGLIMPRSDTFYANVGDNFVFIDINMPQSYVDAAETKLKNAAQAYLDYYSKLRVKYSLKLDYRYIRDNAITLKIGDVIRIIDTDLGIDKQIRIVGLTPNVDGSGIEAEISNFISEKFEKQVTSQLNDALAEITTIQESMASNANWFTLLNRPDWTNYFEIVNPGTAQEYIRAKTNFAADGEVTSFGVDGYTPGSIWDSMPKASPTVLGGVKVGTGLSIDANGVLSATITGGVSSWNDLTDRPSWLTYGTIGEFQSGHTHAFSQIISKPTTLGGYGITDGVLTTDSRLSDARPASDVYAWAKAATKPTYTYSEVGAAAASHNHTGVYEPVITKNTAFNKNFGTITGTVAEGNDSRILNGQTAFGWGNHASAGYLLSSTAASTYVPLTRTVAGKELSSNITLASTDLTDSANVAKIDAQNVFLNKNAIIDGSHYPLLLRRLTNQLNYGVGFYSQLYNSANNLREYAGVIGGIEENTVSTEKGYISLWTLRNGSISEKARIDSIGNLNLASGGFKLAGNFVIDSNRNGLFNTIGVGLSASQSEGLVVAYQSTAVSQLNPLILHATSTGSSKTGIYTKTLSATPFGWGYLFKTYKQNVGFFEAFEISHDGIIDVKNAILINGTSVIDINRNIIAGTGLFSGNVGILNNSPESPLHIGSNTGAKDNVPNKRFALEPPSHTGGAFDFQTRDTSVNAHLDIGYSGLQSFTLRNDGNVGIGITSPTEKLHVSGNILSTGEVTAYSDRRLKSDIQRISNPLIKLDRVNGYTFLKEGKRSAGVIAQEIRAVLPEAVLGTESANSYLSVNDAAITGLLIEAIKEQQREISQLRDQLNNYRRN